MIVLIVLCGMFAFAYFLSHIPLRVALKRWFPDLHLEYLISLLFAVDVSAMVLFYSAADNADPVVPLIILAIWLLAQITKPVLTVRWFASHDCSLRRRTVALYVVAQ